MNKEEIKNKTINFLESKTFKKIVYSFGSLIVIFFVFQAGMIVGFKKASFGRDWGDNYAMNFGFPHGGPGAGPRMMMGEFGEFGNMPNAHGSIGKIIKIEIPTIIVQDEKDSTEKIVLINEKTDIKEMRDSITSDKLKLDDHIIVIGSPNSSGQIEARLIRLLPAPLPEPIQNN